MMLRRYRPVTCLILSLTCPVVLFSSPRAIAQVLQVRPNTPHPASAVEPQALMPPSDADAERWLKRARDAADRQDWKLAADTLSRVIDEYGGKTVSADGGQRYYSARRCALEQLAGWPDEGLAAYRLLYDAQVQVRLDRARVAFDLEALREIATKYPHTTPGPEALDLLASWLLDRGEAAEALDYLDQLAGLKHGTVSPGRVLEKQAIAYILTGQFSAAEEIIDRARKNLPRDEPDADGRLAAIAAALAEARLRDSSASTARLAATHREARPDSTASYSLSSSASPWPTPWGPAQLAGRMPPIDPAVMPVDEQQELLPGAQRVDVERLTRLSELTGRTPVWQMATDGVALFVTCPAGLIARDLSTFELLWQAIPKSRPRDQAIIEHRRNTGMIPVDNRGRLDELSTRVLFHEYQGAVTTAAGLVMVVEQWGTMGEQYPTRQGVAPPNIEAAVNGPEPNSIRAYDAATGRAVWTKGRGGPPEDELRNGRFFSPPIPCGPAVGTSASNEPRLSSPGLAGEHRAVIGTTDTPDSASPRSGLKPQASGPRLVTTYQTGEDFYLIALAPDGQLLQKIALGAGSPTLFPMNAVLMPTWHENSVYVPTGAGLFYALNAGDFSLRWVSSYERSAGTRLGDPERGRAVPGWWQPGRRAVSAQPDEWLSVPPLVVGDLVILAAQDSQLLLGFDRRDGSTRWKALREDHRHLVGALPPVVIVAGKKVCALSLDSGETTWTFDRASITGRPAICGEQVLVPTRRGLIRLDAKTGKEAAEPLATAAPLGNLLAVDGTLYSLGAKALAKFPDVEQSRRRARETLEANPADVPSLLRLAWLAGLERRWKESLGLLDQAHEALVGEGGRRSHSAAAHELFEQRIAHQYVVTLLRIAESAESPERGALLRRAVTTAKRPGDVYQAGEAMCAYFVEHQDAPAAFWTCLDLLRQVGDEPTAPEADLSVRAQVALRERLRRIWRSMSEEVAQRTVARLETRVGEHRSRGEVASLAPWSDALDFCPLGARLDLIIAREFLSKSRYESAIFHLMRAASRAEGGDVGISASCLLAKALLEPPEKLSASPGEAAEQLDRLERRWGDRLVEADLAANENLPDGTTVRQYAEVLRRSLPIADAMSSHDTRNDESVAARLPSVLSGRAALRLLYCDVVPPGMPTDTTILSDASRSHDPSATLLPMRLVRQIHGLDTRAQAPEGTRWAVDLDADEDALPGGISGREDPTTGGACQASIAGRVGLMVADRQYVCVGLATGERLCPNMPIDTTRGPMPARPVVNCDGIFAAAIDSQSLVGLPARGNAKPLWRRTFPGESIGVMEWAAGHLVVIDRPARRLTLLDPASGRIRRQYPLVTEPLRLTEKEKARYDENKTGSVAICGSAVCRAWADRVWGRDLNTGRQLWETRLPAGVRQVRRLDDQRLLAVNGMNHLAVVDTSTGHVVRNLKTQGLTLPPIDATLESAGAVGDERLLVYAVTSDEPPIHVLTALRLSDGEAAWRRGLGPVAMITDRMMRESRHYLSIVTARLAEPETQRKQNMVPLQGGMPEPPRQLDLPRLTIVDKATGKGLLARPYVFEEGRLAQEFHRSRRILDVWVLNERIIAVAPEGYYVLTAGEEPEAVSRGP